MTLSHKEAWQRHNIRQLIEVISHGFEMQIFLVGGGGAFGINFFIFFNKPMLTPIPWLRALTLASDSTRSEVYITLDGASMF